MCDILRTFLSPFMLLYLVEAKFDGLLHMPHACSKMNRNILEPFASKCERPKGSPRARNILEHLPLSVNVLKIVQGLALLGDYGFEKRFIRKLLGLARDV